MISVGIDTSNYTTSIAAFDGDRVINCSKLLEVRPGELGLRQSDALFSHIKNLPDLSQSLFAQLNKEAIQYCGVSNQPRAIEGSYMPCFLAGVCNAELLAASQNIPCQKFSHQQGHIAAVLWSSKRMDLWDKAFLAWHLSGGTTELLLVRGENNNFVCEIIGGTSDISAGQLIDRTGKYLGFPFPSGKWLDASYVPGTKSGKKVKIQNLHFSLSGMENQMMNHFDINQDKSLTASFVLNTIADTVYETTKAALKIYGNLPVVFSGGVSSNSVLRERMSNLDSVFGEPVYSTDNAAGIAILAYKNGVACEV